MRKIIILTLSVFLAIVFINIADAQTKKPAKDNPCITDCKNEYRKCIDAAKKSPKAERKAKFAECEKAHKDCKANCNKSKDTGGK